MKINKRFLYLDNNTILENKESTINPAFMNTIRNEEAEEVVPIDDNYTISMEESSRESIELHKYDNSNLYDSSLNKYQ